MWCDARPKRVECLRHSHGRTGPHTGDECRVDCRQQRAFSDTSKALTVFARLGAPYAAHLSMLAGTRSRRLVGLSEVQWYLHTRHHVLSVQDHSLVGEERPCASAGTRSVGQSEMSHVSI